MDRLGGHSLIGLWPDLDVRQRDRLATQLGEALSALHSVPVRARLSTENWTGFLDGQRAACVHRQRSAGAGAAAHRGHAPAPARHGRGDEWSLSGLFDFEPARGGAREYEFAAVGLFVSEIDARFLRRVLLAYGYARDELDDALCRRLLAYALLHRYSDLSWYLERLPAPAAPTLDAAAARWFGLS